MVRMTKEKHLAHCIAITSDSLFVKFVYKRSELQERCKYFLLDDLDYDEAIKVYKTLGFNESDFEYLWNTIGGKINNMLRLKDEIESGNRMKETINKWIKMEASLINQLLGVIEECGYYEKNGEKIEVKVEEVEEYLKNFVGKEVLEFNPRKNKKEREVLVKSNILFIDPVNEIVKPQSKIIHNAIKKLFT